MIFNSCSYPCTVIDVLSDLWERMFANMSLDVLTMGVVGVVVELLADVKVTVLVVVVINLEFTVPLSYVTEVLSDVWTGTTINVGAVIDDVLSDL